MSVKKSKQFCRCQYIIYIIYHFSKNIFCKINCNTLNLRTHYLAEVCCVLKNDFRSLDIAAMDLFPSLTTDCRRHSMINDDAVQTSRVQEPTSALMYVASSYPPNG